MYNRSGLLPLQQALAALGPDYSDSIEWLSYQLTPRASIFRRDAASVTDLAAMQSLMRSNAFMTDKVRMCGGPMWPASSDPQPTCPGTDAALCLALVAIPILHANSAGNASALLLAHECWVGSEYLAELYSGFDSKVHACALQLSNGNPIAAVCGRGDLDPQMPDARGCFDSKVTSVGLAMRLEALAINGPTTQGGLPPFEWSAQFADVPHAGMPASFDFGWECQSPETSLVSAADAA